MRSCFWASARFTLLVMQRQVRCGRVASGDRLTSAICTSMETAAGLPR